MVDLLGGHVQMMFSPPPESIPHLKTGKLKAIAISGGARSPVLPQVATFAEAGMPGFTAKNWFGILAPAGTPKPVIQKLSAEVARILALPEIRDKLFQPFFYIIIKKLLRPQHARKGLPHHVAFIGIEACGYYACIKGICFLFACRKYGIKSICFFVLIFGFCLAK